MRKRAITSCILFMMVCLLIFGNVNAIADVTTGSFDELRSAINATAAGGTLTLDKDYKANSGESGISISKEITIDLNGHTIDRGLTEATSSGYVFSVSGNLTIMDSTDINQDGTGGGKITGGYSSGSSGCFCVYGTLTLKSGNITKNIAKSYGGGIFIPSGGKVYMTGGAITDNISHDSSYGGGAVCVDGYFTMSGGVISGNKLEVSTTAKGGGGGIASDYGHFIMNGGVIKENYSCYAPLSMT